MQAANSATARSGRPHPLPLKNLLATYTTSHPLRSPSPLPPSSRVDPKLTQRTAPPTSSSPLLWSITTWIVFAQFALAKGIHIIWSLISHFLFGPKRPSWGYRMTFITSFMRNVADHTSLADITLVRRLISLHQIIPLPADAVVTPITFTVPLRTGDALCRGFLREWDAKETGIRELTGEWVVGTDVWRRLKAGRRARQEAERKRRRNLQQQGAGTPGSSVNGENAPGQPRALSGARPHVSPVAGGSQTSNLGRGRDSPDVDSDAESSVSAKKGFVGERVIYYVHGGAYYVGNAATHRLITIGVSKACNARVFAITYRLAPEHPFPLPLHDVLHGYLRLLAPPLSIPPENIVIMGDSAGGGLSLALCMYLRDEGYKMPAGLVLMSPWVDLTMSCGSWDECADTDVVPRPEADDHLNPVGCYLGPNGISRYLTHPYASPLFGDLSDLPPLLIQCGDSEVLRDEVTLLAHKATLSGADVTHELYEDMVHVFQTFTFLPAAEAAIASIGRWVRVTLPKIEDARLAREAAGRLGQQAMRGMDAEVEADPSVIRAEQDGRTEALNGIRDVFLSNQPQTNRKNGLRLDINPEQPSIDLDSLPGSGSGSPTPTASRARSEVDHHGTSTSASSPDRNGGPRLRRAHTAFASSHPSQTSLHNPSSPPTGQASLPGSQTVRRRRPTASAHPATHPNYPWTPSGASSPRSAAAATGPSGPRSSYFPSNPASPSPSIRRRLRSPTLTQPPPKTRERSKSHTDIHNLVEGYVEGGAANETTVYAPGGEIKSVGVLGEDDDDGGF